MCQYANDFIACFMYSKSQLLLKYLQYYFTASNGKGHGMHSPFVFEFITKVLNDKTKYSEYEIVEALRTKLLNDRTILNVEDLGAGSTVSKTDQRTVSSIAKNAAKTKKLAQLLFRMVLYYQPPRILELGTSLGITTSYLSSGNPYGKVTTMEGAKEIAAASKNNFNNLELRNIELVEGNFDDTLPSLISQLSSIDFAFIDGNHRQEPTVRYFKEFLSKTNNDSILVFDDIHWSSEMEAAWKTIKDHEAVRCSIDLFFIGIVLFRKEFKEKQHFAVRF